MQHYDDTSASSATTGITVQLAASYLLVGTVALSMTHWLSSAGVSSLTTIALTLASSVGVGLLVTANLSYDISLLSLALRQLADGTVPPKMESFLRWPLSALFGWMTLAGQYIEEMRKREQGATEYQEHLLRQASEAAAEKERNRLARELHDSIKQQIFSIRMSALAAKTHLQASEEKAQEALTAIQDSASEAQVEMQALLQQLHSSVLEHSSLIEAIQTQGQALQYRSGAQVTVDVSDLPGEEQFPLSMQEAVFRIVQEAFTNIARHARARLVQCTLTHNGMALNVVIVDDGQGFELQSAHKGMGLMNIQERTHALHGTASIESETGKGTTIHVQIPLLLPPEKRQEQELQAQEVKRMVARAHGGLELHAAMSLLTLIILLISLALSLARASINETNVFVGILIFCLFMMLYGLLLAHLSITKVILYRGEEDREALALRLQEHLSWANFLRLLLFSSWYVTLWILRVPLDTTGWRVGLSFLLGAGLMFTLLSYEHYQVKRAQERYYVLLPPHFLSREIILRQRELFRRIILCLCFGVTLFWTGFRPFMLPMTIWQWLGYYLLFSFLVLCVSIVLDERQIQLWRQRMNKMTAVAPPDSVLGLKTLIYKKES